MHFIPNTDEDKRKILEKIGVSSFEALISDIPLELRAKSELNLPPSLSEIEIVKLLQEIAEENMDSDHSISFMGGGYYDHFIPSAVNHIISRSEFYTAYTPYQAEVSQGTLQAIYEYQSMICSLFNMDVSNASLYDGASAMAEAFHLSVVANRREEVLVSETVNPFYRQVMETYAEGTGIRIKTIPSKNGITDIGLLSDTVSDKTACFCVANPNFFGLIEPVLEIEEIVHKRGALFVVCADPISLAILSPPGDYGADVAVGEGQCLGIPQSFGGPGLGIFTCKREFIRLMPGRIAGVTTDIRGNQAFVLTLQTREQHIRREKATSNICTNQGLCALSACVYLSLVGRNGLRKIAELCYQKSHYAFDKITSCPGFNRKFAFPFFKEFVVSTTVPAGEIVRKLLESNILAGIDIGRWYPQFSENSLLVAVTEKRTKEEIDKFVDALGEFSVN